MERMNSKRIGKEQGLFAVARALLMSVLLASLSINAFAFPRYWYVMDEEMSSVFPGKYTDLNALCTQYGEYIQQAHASDPYRWGPGILGSDVLGGYACFSRELNGGEGLYSMSLTLGGCGKGYVPIPGAPDKFSSEGYCASVADIFQNHRPPICIPKTGNPILPLTGEKIEVVDLGLALHGKKIEITYNSGRGPWQRLPEEPYPMLGTFGELWFLSLDVTAQNTVGVNFLGSDGNVASMEFPAGLSTLSPGQRVKGRRDDVDTLEYNTVSGFYGYLLRNQADRSLTYYHSIGGDKSTVAGVYFAAGGSLSYTYSNTAPPGLDYLLSVADNFGRTVSFTYKAIAGNRYAVGTMTDPNGQSYLFDYDQNGNLSQITWPGGAKRTFVYDSPNANQSWAFTGVVDELNVRYSTFSYDAVGRAISSEHAGGVAKHEIPATGNPTLVTEEFYDPAIRMITRYHRWSVSAGPVITGPSGAVEAYKTPDLSLFYPRFTGREQVAGSGCSASASAQTYDANGHVASSDDFDQHRTCYANDPGSNLELVRVEGLANTAVCGDVTASGAALPTGSRKTSSQWHPDWRFKTKAAEPGKLITYVYNGQPDPFSGANASCVVPSPAQLPDGKPIAVLCKQVEQATTDAAGSLGFGAATQAGVPARTRQWTYNRSGQVLTESDTLGHTTSYAYYSDTSFTGADPNAVGHRVGDLRTLTDAAGQVTTFTLYDKAGRVRHSIDPKGIETDTTYTPRGWVGTVATTISNSLPRLTTYAYDDVGQVKSVTLPDGTTLGYTYDAAHRLKGVTDARGNSITYTLDNAGNRTGEEVRDTSGTLQRAISRSFDALNRVQQVTGTAQ